MKKVYLSAVAMLLSSSFVLGAATQDPESKPYGRTQPQDEQRKARLGELVLANPTLADTVFKNVDTPYPAACRITNGISDKSHTFYLFMGYTWNDVFTVMGLSSSDHRIFCDRKIIEDTNAMIPFDTLNLISRHRVGFLTLQKLPMPEKSGRSSSLSDDPAFRRDEKELSANWQGFLCAKDEIDALTPFLERYPDAKDKTAPYLHGDTYQQRLDRMLLQEKYQNRIDYYPDGLLAEEERMLDALRHPTRYGRTQEELELKDVENILYPLADFLRRHPAAEDKINESAFIGEIGKTYKEILIKLRAEVTEKKARLKASSSRSSSSASSTSIVEASVSRGLECEEKDPNS